VQVRDEGARGNRFWRGGGHAARSV
jgi:hypothetical protein